jgi:hypothetical protein
VKISDFRIMEFKNYESLESEINYWIKGSDISQSLEEDWHV